MLTEPLLFAVDVEGELDLCVMQPTAGGNARRQSSRVACGMTKLHDRNDPDR
jgi:hypothetical protein